MNDLDFSKKGRVPDSIKDVALKYLRDPSFEALTKEHFKELGDNPKEEHLLGWFLWKQPYPTYRVMSQFLFRLRQSVCCSHDRNSELESGWLRETKPVDDERPTRFMSHLDYTPSFALLDAFAIPKDKQTEFVRWLTPASEMDLRKEAGTKKGMDWLEFQLRLIRSSDDPLLRIPRAIEFFTLHPQFLQRPECQKYLLSTFFQVSLQDGSCAWREYLKNAPKTGLPLAVQFIQQGLEKFSDHAEVFCFFLEMGLFMYNHLSQEQQKSIVLFPKSVLDSLSRSSSLQTDPTIIRRLLVCSADILYPMITSPSTLQDSGKKRWPFLVPNTKFSDLHLDQMSPEQRSQTLSLYLFGRDFGDKWEYKDSEAICGNYTVDMQDGKIWYLGYSLAREEDEETSTVPWKQNFPSSNTHCVGYNDEHFFSILRDRETGREYLLRREEGQQRFYQKSDDKWLPLIPIGQLEHLPIFSQLGISAKNGWTAIYEDGSTVLQDKNQIARFRLTKEGLQEAQPPHLFALDPSKNEGGIFYKTCREMDPRVQLWGEKGDDDSYQVKRLDFPTLGLQFAVQEQKIVGKGEWEGFDLEPDRFLPSLSQLHHKLVLRSQKTGERVVIIPQGKVASSKDMTVPMSVGFNTSAKLHVFSLQKNGRLKATDRSGWLYLASLYFHMKQPRLACACLKKGHSSASYQTSELVQLKILLEDAKKSDTIDAISVALHAFLALEKSLHLPWKRPASLEETEQQTGVTTCIQDVPSIQNLFSRYQERIAHVSEGCRIHKEDLARLQQRFPSPTGYISVSEHITFSDLSEKDLLDILPHCNPKEVDVDLFSKRVVPTRGTFAEVAPHFLSLYAIAKAGSPLQHKQLLTWLFAVRAMKHGQDDSQFGSVADFLRKILAMEEKGRSALPTPVALKAFTVKEEWTPLVKAVHKMVLPKHSPIPTQPSPRFAEHTKSLRKDLLRPSSLPIDRIHSSCLKKLTKQVAGPLFEGSPITQQAISAFPQPLLSIAGLDQEGGSGYKKAFESLQASAEAYQTKAAEEGVWEIGDTDQGDVYKKVEEGITQAKQQFLDSKKALLAKVRSPNFLLGKDLLVYQLEQASGIRDTLRWSDLLALFAKQDANAYRAQIPSLTKAQAEEIYQETAICLMQQVALQRLEQAKSILLGKKPGELLPQKEPESLPKLSSEQVKELHRLLWEKRPSYPMDRYPAILLFEAISGKLLRADQLENLEKLADPTQDVLLEAIMGSGKSEVLLPLFAQTIADGEHLGLLVLPKEQMQSGGVRLERRLRDIFEKESVQLDWQDVSLPNLQAIFTRLQEARTKGQVVWLYADQLQHFFLQEKAALQRHFAGDEEATKALPVFKEIRKLLREKGVALVDEAHLQLMRKRECQKPLGSKRPLDAAFREAACDLQLLLLTDETICKRWFFQTSRPGSMAGKPFLKEVHQKKLRRALAKAFVAKRYTKQEDADVAKKVLSFLRVRERDVGSLLQTLPEAEREVLAFVRGQIWTILPTTLSKKWGEEYGLFPPREKEGTTAYLAGPYRSSEPVYGSTFATPDEQLAFTIQSYLMTGVPEDILKESLTALQLLAKQKSLSFHQPMELTEEYIWYQQFVGDVKDCPFARPNYALLAEATRRDPVRLRAFLLKFVLPKIEYYPETAVENGYSFVRHLKTVKAVSGTFYAPFTLHHRFSWALRPEIEGEGFALLTKEKEPILLTEKIEGIPLLEKLFRENRGVTPRAIVDQGGLIKEDPFKIAKAILEYTEKADPQVDRVIYFDKDEQMVLERNAKEPKKYTPNSARPETSFTFYDQSHATGTDIPQDSLATALVTVHETTPLAYLLQAAFRMRQIAKGQSVRFVASYPLTAAINSLGKKEITSDDLLCYAKHIQTTSTLEENYKTVLEQLKEMFLEECEKLLDRRLDKEVFAMMLRKNSFDPIASWATSSFMTEPEVVFRQIQKMLVDQLKKHLSSEEVGDVEKRMEALILRALKKEDRQVPDRVSSQQVFSEGREAELQREQVQEQQQQSVQEQQQQQQQTQTIHLSQGSSSSSLKIPLFDPAGFIRCDLQSLCSLTKVPNLDATEGVTIYPVQAFLQGSSLGAAFLEKLPAKLLFSRDVVGGVSGTTPFGPNRKAIGGVLRVPDLTDPNKVPYMIVLSKKESQMWIDALAKGYAPKPFDRAVLCSLALEAFYQKGGLAQGESLEGGEGVEKEDVEKLVALPQNFAVEKWLMGEIYAYTPDELEKLATWIRGFKDVAALEKLFLEKFLLPEEREFYSVSPLRKIFEAVIPKPIAPPIQPVPVTITPIRSARPSTSAKVNPSQSVSVESHGKKAKERSFFQRLRLGKIVKSLVLFPFQVVLFPFWSLWRLFVKKKS